MRRTIHPSGIDATIAAPPSKSLMIRAAAAALLAGDERTTILNPSLCGDARSALDVVEALGGSIRVSPDEVWIQGGLRPREAVLDCGESGLTLRLFTAVAALCSEELTLTGGEPLLRRPATSIEPPVAALGASCRARDGFPPVTVRGPLRGGEAVVNGGLSSQFLSGLLMALPCADADSTIHVRSLTSRPYVELTLELLRRFGIRVDRDGFDRFDIPGGQRPSIGEYRVEGDWSAAATLLVLGAVAGRVRVTGLDPESAQADREVLRALEAAGAEVTLHDDGAEAARGSLSAFEFDATDAPDLVPPLAVLACHCEGTTVFRNVGRLRHKESSRAEVVARELDRLGIPVRVGEDALEVTGGPIDGGSVDAHGDHRIAMAMAAAGVAARGPVAIDGAEHVAKTYPRFFEDLAEAGGEVK